MEEAGILVVACLALFRVLLIQALLPQAVRRLGKTLTAPRS